MDSAQPDSTGLPAHLVQQLHEASRHVAQSDQVPHHGSAHDGHREGNRGRSQNPKRGIRNRQHYPQHSGQPQMNQAFQPARQNQQSENLSQLPQYSRSTHPMSVNHGTVQRNTHTPQANSEDDFPALGSSTSTKSGHSSSQTSSFTPGPPSGNQDRAQTVFQHTRGGVYHGKPVFTQHSLHQSRPQQQSFVPQPQSHVQQYQADDFRRPPPQQQGVYNPMAASVANQQHAFRKRFKLQCEYLETVSDTALQNQISVKEQEEKEVMRQKLEDIMHDVISTYSKTQSTIEPHRVKLKCYGSLATGFAVAGSDMDLLVTFPRNGESIGNIVEDIKRLFEKALLNAGYGARLLTQTRVPIMRVCESPTPDILDGLRRYRAKWEQTEQDSAVVINGDFDPNRLPVTTRQQIEAISDIFAELGDDPSSVPLPPSPGRDFPHLEYTKDCGIQCDINFSNYVALHNTRLLRTYCLLDERVRCMGLIVKAWAKARKINTPYHGTLSSYGYILMVLHFLINIASPPVIPNLQVIAKEKDAWAGKTEFETVDGFDVRFANDPVEVAAASDGRQQNLESLGSLLRGFFCYYSDHQGFHWTNEIISIRTTGGALSKRSKGWTEAKWTGAKNTIKNRYLLCIEDPFEVEHNIARTVCHSGIVAIRDEFRRARMILERVDKVRGAGWQWYDDKRQPGEDFMAAAEDRGDLLRKDQDFHKLKRLRAEANATERALKEANALVELQDGGAGESSEQDGTSNPRRILDNSVEAARPLSSRMLTQSVGYPQVNQSPTQKGRLRRIRTDSNDGTDEEYGPRNHQDEHADSKELSVNKSLSANVKTALSNFEAQDESEPPCFEAGYCVPRAVDSLGKPFPWDLNTQEGRWLNWRDGKVRNGTFTGILNPGLRTLNEQCPFDPMRPLPTPRSHQGNLELIRPPFPMSKPDDDLVTSGDSAIAEEGPVNLHDADGAAVGWDLSISDCRWLSKRDQWMRAGTFRQPSEPHVRNLHEEFPYISNTPSDEQKRRNKVLRQRHEKWLNGEISQLEKDNLCATERGLCDTTSTKTQDHVGWDMSLSDGRWLSKRDAMVRNGSFDRNRNPPQALKLHDDFPYIANPPPLAQHQRNLELKLRHVRRQLAALPDDIRNASTEDESELPAMIDAPHSYTVGEQKDSISNNKMEVEPQSVKPKKGRSWKAAKKADPVPFADTQRTATATQQGQWEDKGPQLLQFGNEALETTKASSRDQDRPSASELIKSVFSEDLPEMMAQRRPRTVRKNDIHFEAVKWLRWRDRQGHKGSWTGAIKPQFQALDVEFPFDFTMTPKQQIGRELLVKEFVLGDARMKFFRQGRLENHQLNTARARPETVTIVTDTVRTEVVGGVSAGRRAEVSESSSDFVRRNRLQYFAFRSATIAATSAGKQDADSTGSMLRKGNPQDQQSQTASGEPPSSTLHGTGISLTTASLEDHTKATIENVMLHTGPLEACPRPEDLNIMPIPSNLSFAFDERQLRDLGIIEQGGNGCARFGEEWDVELEGEWGGGGRVGEKSSKEQGEESSSPVEGEKWNGRGDAEGLLGELPCL